MYEPSRQSSNDNKASQTLARYQRIGLITGVYAEQRAFLPDHQRHVETVAGLKVNRITAARTNDLPEVTVVACTPGIGKVNAAGAAAILAATYDLELLTIIGTAGKIDPSLEPAAYLLSDAVHADYGAHRHGAFVHYRAGSLPIGEPDTSPFRSGPASMILADEPSVPSARIASGDSFVEDAERSRSLHDATGASLVDMETAAIAQLAELLGLEWLAVKAVSDDANEESATSFAEQLATASEQAAVLFERLLGVER